MPEVKKDVQGEKDLEGLTEEELAKLIEEKKEDYEYYKNELETTPCVGNERRFLYSAIEYHKLLVEQAKNELDYAGKKYYSLLVEQAKNESEGDSEKLPRYLIRLLQNSKKLPVYFRNIIKRSILIIKTNTAIKAETQNLEELSEQLKEYAQDYEVTYDTKKKHKPVYG